MIRHHPHKAKKHVTPHRNNNYSAEQKSHALPVRKSRAENDNREIAKQPEMDKQRIPLFMAWPFYWFEQAMNPMRNFSTMLSWMDNWHALSTSAMPKSDSRETDKEYIYRVELPQITRDQIDLHFQNRMIMLRVKEPSRKEYRHRDFHPLSRAFSLPVYTNGEAITAKLQSGILTITIPKTDKPVSPQARNIEIS